MSFVEFQIFDDVAGELRSWISWLENFFVRDDFTADEKLNLAQSLLEGEAESWFYRRQKMFLFRSWEHLKDSLLLRFGEFDDPELIWLITKQDRLLKEKRDAAKIQRMKTTSINPQESILSVDTFQETIQAVELNAKESIETELKQSIEETQSQQVDEISEELKELKEAEDLRCWKIDSQLQSRFLNVNCHINENVNFPNTQVHISNSEKVKNMELTKVNSELDSRENVGMKVTMEKEPIQKNIKMIEVDGDAKMFQNLTRIKTNCSAYHLFDKMSRQKERQKTEKKRKGLKAWMFKFKHEKRQIKIGNNHDWFNTCSSKVSWRKNTSTNVQIVPIIQPTTSFIQQIPKTHLIEDKNVASPVVEDLQEGTWFFTIDPTYIQTKSSSYGKMNLDAYKIFEIKLSRSHILHQRRQLSLASKPRMFKFKNSTSKSMNFRKLQKFSERMLFTLINFQKEWWLQNGSEVQWHIFVVTRVIEIFEELKTVQNNNAIIVDTYVLSYSNHYYKFSWQLMHFIVTASLKEAVTVIEHSQHHEQDKFSTLWLIKFNKRSGVDGKLVTYEGNYISFYLVDKNVYFSVWHCWRKKMLQKISLKHWLLQTFLHHHIQGSTFWTLSCIRSVCVQQCYHGLIDCLSLFFFVFITLYTSQLEDKLSSNGGVLIRRKMHVRRREAREDCVNASNCNMKSINKRSSLE